MADWNLIPVVYSTNNPETPSTTFLVDHFIWNNNLQYIGSTSAILPSNIENPTITFLKPFFVWNENLHYIGGISASYTAPDNSSSPQLSTFNYQVWG